MADVNVHTKELTRNRLKALSRYTRDMLKILEEAKKSYNDSAVNEPFFERVDVSKAHLAEVATLTTQIILESGTARMGTIYPFEIRVEWLHPDLNAVLDFATTGDYIDIPLADDILATFDEGSASNRVVVVGTNTNNDGDYHNVDDYTSDRLNVNSSPGVTSVQTGLTTGGVRLVAYE